MHGEGGGDGQQRARVASVREWEGDQQVGTNRHGAWVAGVCCVCMACTLHGNGVGRGGRASGSGERAGGGVRALDAERAGQANEQVGVCAHWMQWVSRVTLVGHGTNGAIARLVRQWSWWVDRRRVQLAGLSHVTMMAGWVQADTNYDWA